jgi:TonB family protein
MILAVALEVTVCSLLVALPLFSTGIISVSAQPPRVTPQVERVTIIEHHPTGPTGNSGHDLPTPHVDVVRLADGRNLIFRPAQTETGGPEPPPNFRAGPEAPTLPRCDSCWSKPGGPTDGDRPRHVSEGVLGGYLLRRIDPIYPHMAVIAGVRGEVRLHAIISKDGAIESLSVISGHPMLVPAAVDAVRQWRYRPYLLNHEPVEVETFITVNFTGGH